MPLFSCHDNSPEATELRMAELQLGGRMPVLHLTLKEQETHLCCEKLMRCWSLLLLYSDNHPATPTVPQDAEAGMHTSPTSTSCQERRSPTCILPGG